MPLAALPEPESRWKRILGLFRGSVALLVLLSTLFAFNGMQVASLAIKPFSLRAFRAINRWGANTWWGWCDLWSEHLWGIRVTISGDDVPVGENAVVILNHQEMSDIVVLFRFARRKERLGDLKWFVKDKLKYVPGIGWGMLFLDCLFIKRDWTDDQDYIRSIFEKILKNLVPVWIVSFVEGTRLTPAKIERSKKYAKKQGHTPLSHLLLPRTKGFVATVQSLTGHVDAVYDVTIGYVGGVPTLWQWAKGYVRHINLHVRRFPLSELPREIDEIGTWLIKRFEEKDRLLDHYYRHGSFQDFPRFCPRSGARGGSTPGGSRLG